MRQIFMLSVAVAFLVVGTGVCASTDRSEKSMQKAIEPYKGKLYAQYNKALNRNPKMHGTVVATLTVEAGGAVRSCSTEGSSIQDGKFLEAVCGVLGIITFPRAAGSGVSEYEHKMEFIQRP